MLSTIELQIKIVQQSIDNIVKHLNITSDEWETKKSQNLLKEYTEELDKYKSKYPEYFI